MKKVVTYLTSAIVLAMPMLAAAQSSFSSREDGSGTLSRGSQRFSLNRAEVSLERNGRASLTVRNRDRSWTFKGIWNEDRSRTAYAIEIREAYDDLRARGVARVNVRDGRIVAIALPDGFADGSSFRVDFESRWLSDDRPGSWLEFNLRETGRGSYRTPSQDVDFRDARFEVRRDRTFTITLGARNIRGTYRRSGNNLILDLDAAFLLDRVTGAGTISLGSDNRTVTGFSVSGSSRQGRFSGTWRRDRDSVADGWSFNFDQRGEGDLRVGDERRRLRFLEAEFERKGNFSITLETDRGEFEVEGSWERRDSRTIVFEIKRAGGRNARGTGTVDLDRNGRLDRLSLTGEQLFLTQRVRFNGTFYPR